MAKFTYLFQQERKQTILQKNNNSKSSVYYKVSSYTSLSDSIVTISAVYAAITFLLRLPRYQELGIKCRNTVRVIAHDVVLLSRTIYIRKILSFTGSSIIRQRVVPFPPIVCEYGDIHVYVRSSPDLLTSFYNAVLS